MSERAVIFVYPPKAGAAQTWRGLRGWRGVILDMTSGVAFEVDQVGGSLDAAEVGFVPPFESGLWIWRGAVHYPNVDLEPDEGPEFAGEWRRPAAAELAELAGPVERAPSLRPPGVAP